MKHINNINISNFKSIRQASIEDCNVINVFIGKPNAGKSNLLEALGLYGMFSLDRNDVHLADFVRQNNYQELFFEGDTGREAIVELDSSSIKSTFSYGELFLHYKTLDSGDPIRSIIFDSYNEENDRNSEVKIKKDFTTRNRVKKYNFSGYVSSNKVSNKDSLEFPSGKNIGRIIASVPELRAQVNLLFKQNDLKFLIEKSTNDLKIFKEYNDGTVFTLSYNMIADTLQRLIFYKAAIISNDESVLLFEEPEAHCFEPYIQEFTNAVKYDKNKNQFFIVTHSDFIIQEFLRDDDSKAKTNIYLVNNVQGETQVKLMKRENNEDVYELGMNAFFNFDQLWENN
ncbi:AAA family ATPase [Flavobacterium aurantiibacter]|uniref:AAA family ATPase n=1 Tax=Flavobacterium aurantiibacter TaxID=2023067 RepID=UPI0013FE2E90|nr:AAA family ATPase [Flavobacterium aurantiibacter]